MFTTTRMEPFIHDIFLRDAKQNLTTQTIVTAYIYIGKLISPE